ncbi:hypothetical protein ACAW49_14760 [Pseudomonas sp. Env-44]|jgi:hypothetical protein|uniref:hypothetical protein n=1 Tax=Pseudomonas TaxID=286 RepID=UPI000CD4836B|nr:hypothetical protein [Pseudomonas rhodesiae]POH42585.1 hypothetical protein C2U56_05280 [Pseudomonas fluorescens]
MTNQTIDGVPRELLESVLEIAADQWTRTGELRALLDAKPAEVTGDDAMELTVDHQQFIAGDHEDLIDNASDFQDRAYSLGIARGAARGAMQPAPAAVVLGEAAPKTTKGDGDDL